MHESASFNLGTPSSMREQVQPDLILLDPSIYPSPGAQQLVTPCLPGLCRRDHLSP
ncbi:MAG: hypothetical protein ACLFP6_01295 [Spirochaetaceae bacterium]